MIVLTDVGNVSFGIWIVGEPYTGGCGTKHQYQDHHSGRQDPDPPAQDRDKFFGRGFLLVVPILFALAAFSMAMWI